MNEGKNEGSENEDCEELEKATQNVHVNVSYCIFISTCINPSVPGLLKTKISDQSAKTCLECSYKLNMIKSFRVKQDDMLFN